jgi:hypothetical protein
VEAFLLLAKSLYNISDVSPTRNSLLNGHKKEYEEEKKICPAERDNSGQLMFDSAELIEP